MELHGGLHGVPDNVGGPKGHYRQKGIQEGKPRNKSEISNGQPDIIRVGQDNPDRNQGKGKDNECATQRN